MTYLCIKFCHLKTIRFAQPTGDFFASLRKSVQQYFDEQQMDQSGNAALYIKTAVIVGVYIALYVAIVALPIPGYLALIFAAFLGFVQALVGFNIMHDACHDAYSKNKTVNYIFGLSMNALGSDAFMWRQKHNLVHHTYTNIDGVDNDIEKTPFLRMSATQPRYKAHRFQHIYMPLLYGISTIYWVLVKDFEDYILGSRFSVEVGKMKPIDHVVFWTTRLIYFGLYLVLPAFVWGTGWSILGFVLMHLMLGLTMSFVFQLAHVVENVEFEHAGGDNLMVENEWAVHQISTTSDFATENKVVSWFLGGLNYQVEHHLFPRISHVHYPAIQKIVKQKCEEFGVEYRYYPKTRTALASHFRHMRNLGRVDS